MLFFSRRQQARNTSHDRTAAFTLSAFYAGWDVYQQRLVAAIAPLTAEQLALRTTPRHWSIGMYATHIVANRAWWFQARMGEGATI